LLVQNLGVAAIEGDDHDDAEEDWDSVIPGDWVEEEAVLWIGASGS
jgi:hypothetical protein